MTLQERIELHDQWLRSVESNLNQVSADLAAMSRNQEAIVANLAEVTRHQALFTATFAQALARLTDEEERLARNQAELQGEVRSLAQIVERYIRFRGDGQPQN